MAMVFQMQKKPAMIQRTQLIQTVMAPQII
jgi:hypothetical protein